MPVARPKPLSNLRVLDLSRLLPGPMATLHLADLGASVISIEPVSEEEGLDARMLRLMLSRNKRKLRLDRDTARMGPTACGPATTSTTWPAPA